MNEFRTPGQRGNAPQGWQQYDPAGGWGSLQQRTAADATVAERMTFIRKVYALFFAATLFAVGGVALGMSFEPLFWFAAWVSLVLGLCGAALTPRPPGRAGPGRGRELSPA